MLSKSTLASFYGFLNMMQWILKHEHTCFPVFTKTRRNDAACHRLSHQIRIFPNKCSLNRAKEQEKDRSVLFQYVLAIFVSCSLSQVKVDMSQALKQYWVKMKHQISQDFCDFDVCHEFLSPWMSQYSLPVRHLDATIYQFDQV